MLNHQESGSGRPFVLLHAFPLHAGMWDSVRDRLGQRLITPDLRGFGGSALGADEPSLAASAADVLELADRLGLDRFVLGGLSMGGYVAMRLLAVAPERVEALVLADTKATADTPAAQANRERIAAAVESGDRDVLRRDVLPTLIAADAASAVRDRVAALIDAAPAAAVAWAQRAMAGRPDSLPVLRSFRGPALVIRGSQDGLSTGEDAAAMAAAVPDARSVEIAGSGHLSAMERPAEFAAAVRDFLAP
ncbi:MAG TPA: alpha/beta hydrolase [Mycobacteriales bacterium]|nr:alpha/beta hydrolase [Mycobacteriales bacterium]